MKSIGAYLAGGEQADSVADSVLLSSRPSPRRGLQPQTGRV